MKASDIREMTPEERRSKLEELREELYRLRVRAKFGNLENAVAMRNIRRDIARILTVESELRKRAAAGAKRSQS
jgi:large subunit ribosomal protein L29